MHLLVDFGDYHKYKNSRYFSLFCFLQSITHVVVKSLPTSLLFNFKVRYTNSENYLSSAPCLTKQIKRGSEATFKNNNAFLSCKGWPRPKPRSGHASNSAFREELLIDLSNPADYMMHHQFNIQQLYVLPTLYLCVLYLSENKQRLVPLTA